MEEQIHLTQPSLSLFPTLCIERIIKFELKIPFFLIPIFTPRHRRAAYFAIHIAMEKNVISLTNNRVAANKDSWVVAVERRNDDDDAGIGRKSEWEEEKQKKSVMGSQMELLALATLYEFQNSLVFQSAS